MEEAIKYVDFAVVWGHRNEEDQNKAYARGNSKVRYPESKHNLFPSKAVDIIPWPSKWESREQFYFMAGVVMSVAQRMGLTLRWGGDWDRDGDFSDQRFDDLAHFEVV